MPYEFDWVDAFTESPFGGNGCAVVHGADDLEVAQRLALVRETSLSECAYLVSSTVADFGVRYYLASREILMAGHPTIATVTSLVHRNAVQFSGDTAVFTLEVGAGVLPIRVRRRDRRAPVVTMTQQRPIFGAYQDPSVIARMYGLSPDAVIGRPRIVSTGTPFCIAVLRDRDVQRQAVLDVALLDQWRRETGDEQAALMEPYLVTLEGATQAGNTYARLLLPPPMPAEDPFTGSATGCMAAYLWSENLIPAPAFIAEQGHDMGRPGQAEVQVLGPRNDISGVEVSGAGVVLMQGQLHL